MFDQQGKCDWAKTSIKGSRMELRSYVLAVIKNFCKRKILNGYDLKRSNNIDLSYRFNTYSNKYVEPKILGNVILFDLPGHQQKGEWRLGPIKGNLIAPNFIFLNEDWFTDNSPEHNEK